MVKLSNLKLNHSFSNKKSTKVKESAKLAQAMSKRQRKLACSSVVVILIGMIASFLLCLFKIAFVENILSSLSTIFPDIDSQYVLAIIVSVIFLLLYFIKRYFESGLNMADLPANIILSKQHTSISEGWMGHGTYAYRDTYYIKFRSKDAYKNLQSHYSLKHEEAMIHSTIDVVVHSDNTADVTYEYSEML